MKTFKEFTKQKIKPEDIAKKVKKVLTPDLLKPEYRKNYSPDNPTYGHCYAATEALHHLLGKERKNYTPQTARDSSGGTHWWLKHNQTGKIVDVTSDQYKKLGETPPYESGRGCGFLTKQPSKRAAEIMKRVKSAKN